MLWQHQGIEEVNWEHEDMMRVTYPFLFKDEGVLSNIGNIMKIAYACNLMCICVGISGRNSFKEIRM